MQPYLLSFTSKALKATLDRLDKKKANQWVNEHSFRFIKFTILHLYCLGSCHNHEACFSSLNVFWKGEAHTQLACNKMHL